METLNRRALLSGAAALTLAAATPRSHAFAHGRRVFLSCPLCARAPAVSFISAATATPFPIVRSPVDAETNRLLGIALARLAQTFKVSPGFAFFDDTGSPNAVASQESVLEEGQGSVLFGTNLFARMDGYRDSGVTLLGILAHEFAHIVQGKRGYRNELKAMGATARPIELHADYLAGYYLAVRAQDVPGLDLSSVGAAFYRLGDVEFNAPEHHGTPDERSNALRGGFAFGKGQGGDVDEAARVGLGFVRRMS